MNEPLENFLARSETRFAALCRWDDARQRDRLNRVNAGRLAMRSVLNAARGTAEYWPLDEVDAAALMVQLELRETVAKACAPWFEVQQ